MNLLTSPDQSRVPLFWQRRRKSTLKVPFAIFLTGVNKCFRSTFHPLTTVRSDLSYSTDSNLCAAENNMDQLVSSLQGLSVSEGTRKLRAMPLSLADKIEIRYVRHKPLAWPEESCNGNHNQYFTSSSRILESIWMASHHFSPYLLLEKLLSV